MAVSMKWNGAEVERFVDRQVIAGLTAAGLELQRISRKYAGRTNSGVAVAIKNPKAGGNATQRTIYPDSSKPGESPKRRTGFGQKNIVFGVSESLMIARVGFTASARYMTFHELGIRYAKVGFQKRPTLVPALQNNLPRLRQLFARAAGRVRP